MIKVKPLSWKAVRRGHIYCAPACGANCTLLAYKLARDNAKKLCKRLGKGWKPEVWENLGWHWSVRSPCGRIAVRDYPDHLKNSRYSASLGEKDSPGCFWYCLKSSPEKAIAAVIAVALMELSKIGAVLKGLA